MNDRTPYDCRPFYCETCGLGLREYSACEEPDCKLETEDAAIARAQSRLEDLKSRIEVGKEYKPRKGLRSAPRTVIHIGRETVQYDSAAVKLGQRFPTMGIEDFARWAGLLKVPS